MKTALANQDVNGALKYFTPHAENKYRYVFESLLPDLPEIAGTMEPIRLVETQGLVIECFTNRVEDGVLNAYFIYFSRDPNGLWKLSAM